MSTDEAIRELERRGVKATVASAKATSLFAGAGAAEDAPREQTLILPFPPTVNHYWVSFVMPVKGKKPRVAMAIGEDGRAFRKAVTERFNRQKGFTMKGPLAFVAIFDPPNSRRRDLDNLLKPVIDALKRRAEDGFAGAYFDDSQIRQLSARFEKPKQGGESFVLIRQLD